LAAMQKDIAGTVKFIFQPAEEGPPEGEEGGAALMVKEGVMDNPKVDAIFGLHISSGTDIGKITYKVGPDYAASDWFTIKIKGKQAHGSAPWAGIDPVVVGAQIVNSLQTIVSRQENIVRAPVVVTVAKFHGGVRNNIIPEETELGGTIRTLDERMRRDVHQKIKTIATNIAEANGASVTVTIDEKTEVTFNDTALVQMTMASLQKAAGPQNVLSRNWTTGAEDFSYFGLKAPAFYFNLGARNKDTDAAKVGHHTPDFYIDDSQLDVGVRAFCNIVMDYPAAKQKWEKEQALRKKGF
jgi:amidohydrolase